MRQVCLVLSSSVKKNVFIHIYRFGEDSMEVADSSFFMAISYTDDDESLDKAKKYLKDAITLYMKHRGPYNNSTIKAQVQFKVISVHIVVFCCISCKGNLDT